MIEQDLHLSACMEDINRGGQDNQISLMQSIFNLKGVSRVRAGVLIIKTRKTADTKVWHIFRQKKFLSESLCQSAVVRAEAVLYGKYFPYVPFHRLPQYS